MDSLAHKEPALLLQKQACSPTAAGRWADHAGCRRPTAAHLVFLVRRRVSQDISLSTTPAAPEASQERQRDWPSCCPESVSFLLPQLQTCSSAAAEHLRLDSSQHHCETAAEQPDHGPANVLQQTATEAQSASRIQSGLSQYGARATARLRPFKYSKRRKLVAPEQDDDSPPGADFVKAAQRQRHVASLTQLDVAAVVDNLRRPDGSNCGFPDRLEALQRLSDLTRMPGCRARRLSELLKWRNFQGLCVHPGWHAVLPCRHSIVKVYEALESNSLQLPVHLMLAGQTIQTLQELLTAPQEQFVSMLTEGTSRIVNAMTFMQHEGDDCHQRAMSDAGTVGLLGAVWCYDKGLGLTGHDLLDASASRSSRGSTQPPSTIELKAFLRLDRRQVQLTRKVWAETCRAVEELETERRNLLSVISPADVQHLAWQQPTSTTQSSRAQLVMNHAAKLAENARLQQEIVRHGSRVFIWQVCTPDTAARINLRTYPAVPDLVATLRAVATSK
ncbi:hypothetical protein WJX74_009251 [Apatococcus lobatus]|uniref:Uncharacterized protein n=1 Tax=Apatococcus lobatus TaxID=904363 RepID=A0AAW1RA07_9CHLO